MNFVIAPPPENTKKKNLGEIKREHWTYKDIYIYNDIMYKYIQLIPFVLAFIFF